MINPTKRSRLVAWMVLTGVAQAAAAQAMDESRPRPAAATSSSQASAPAPADLAASPKGYYRMPAIAGDRLLFCAEGDLWSVPLTGGRASRLTSHPRDERLPVVSPDGLTVAFTGEYEGPPEVYTMPIAGGRPTRRTYFGGRSSPVAWQNPQRLIIATPRHSTLPNTQLLALTLDGERTTAADLLPLFQAADAAFDGRGTLFFTRLDFQGSHTRRYAGGTAQNLWRLDPPGPGGELAEAVPLTAGYDGTSTSPMFFEGRLYFRSDRSESTPPAPAAMNIWSMTPDGTDLRRHTAHDDFEVRSPSLSVPGPSGAGRGRIAYQLGADIWVLDLADGRAAPVEIRLETDLDQTREKWIDKPMTYVTSARLSPDGEHAAITARGEVFVAPRKFGRLVEVTRNDGVRYRDARFLPVAPGAEAPPDLAATRLVALSDESGEVELWTLPANGVGDNRQLTTDGDVLRWEAVPSPDGKLIAHHDKNLRLWIYDVEKNTSTKIDENTIEGFADLRWSPDGRYLAYAAWCSNLNMQLKLYDARSGAVTALTSDRTSSVAPAWHPGGEFIYFLSERNLESLVSSPWGTLQPEPFFDKRMKVFAIALKSGLPSPFDEPNELTPKEEKDDAEDAKPDAQPEARPDAKPDAPGKQPDPNADKTPENGEAPERKKERAPEAKPIEIELNGLADRVYATHVPPGNYAALSVNDKALFFIAADAAPGEPRLALQAFAIDSAAMKKREWKVETLAGEIKGYELSRDGKSLLIHTESALAIVDAEPARIEDLSKSALRLDGWKLSVRPREEWRQMFREAWRLHRDYFYDRAMHGVDWPAMMARYAPLIDRVASRADLSDVLAQLIAELSALHHFVVGGDLRDAPENVPVATLGAKLVRDEPAGGFRIQQIYESDPDRPELVSPLARPGLDIRPGDVVTMIDGLPALDAPDPSALLRNKAGRQVLLHTTRQGGQPRPSIVTPASMATDRELRYRQWELERRRMVEELGKGEIGYIHLRAMGGGDIADFARQYYPVFTRKGLIIDVRHNGGGNIDSWVLSRLMRKAWFFWQGRVGEPTWNMQFAFRGHMVALCNEETASDGEAFSEGFRRLGLGKVIGTRTWGGEIWLSFSNYLVDKGIASAAEIGVYGPEGAWLIEGRGVEPDIIIDNLPVATARGEDAQLKAAVEHLQQRLRDQPVVLPPPPRHPDKSWKPARP